MLDPIYGTDLNDVTCQVYFHWLFTSRMKRHRQRLLKNGNRGMSCNSLMLAVVTDFKCLNPFLESGTCLDRGSMFSHGVAAAEIIFRNINGAIFRAMYVCETIRSA
ncbi:hypothetical protein BDR04DRAFT_266038 [Suillus decipiens]|nr:hypothetical protein BDR04DRAFT_266038 [Suillus decipiens]